MKDIEGKVISHENLSENGIDEMECGSRKNSNIILKDFGLNTSIKSQGSGILPKEEDEEDSDDDENDYFGEDDFERGIELSKNEFKMRIDPEVRFKLNPDEIEETEKPADPNAAKRNSLLFPAYSILKNSPLVQPSDFKALK